MRRGHWLSFAAAVLCAVTLFCTIPQPLHAEESWSEDQLKVLDADALKALRLRIDARLREIGEYEFVKLSEGSHGDEVTALQERLKALGYYTKEVSGRYQGTTVRAMKDFEKAAGLPRDGAASVADQKALFAPDAPVQPTPAPTATPKPTRTPRPTAVPTPTRTPRPTRTPDLARDYPPFDFRLTGLMPTKYAGSRYKVNGEIIALMNNGSQWLIRLSDSSQRLVAAQGFTESRGIGDAVQIWGVYEGLTSYMSESGEVSLPLIVCEHVE